MQALGRFLYYAQIPAALLLSVWVAIGRALFGAGGWMGFITIFIVAPVLFIWLLLLAGLNRMRNDTGRAKRFGAIDIILMVTVYLCALSAGFFLVDMGDTDASIGSAFSNIAGRQFVTISGIISYVCFFTGLFALVSASVYAIIRCITCRQPKTLR